MAPSLTVLERECFLFNLWGFVVMKCTVSCLYFILLAILPGCSLFRSSSGAEAPVRAIELTPSTWSSLGKPGPSHRLLDLFVGSWTTVTRVVSDAQGSKVKYLGKSRISWMLGNRFVKEDFEGTMLDLSFQGIGIMGYDNGARRYSSVWADSISTALVSSSGRYFAEQNRFEFLGEVYDPLQSRTRSVRTTIDIVSNNEYVVSTYEPSATGDEVKTLEIRYERVG